MAEAYIYDAVRTPRGKGRKDGKLHEITPIQLGTQVLQAVRDRTQIDTHDVDDVIFGCVAPVGEQGSDIARVAVLNADYAERWFPDAAALRAKLEAGSEAMMALPAEAF